MARAEVFIERWWETGEPADAEQIVEVFLHDAAHEIKADEEGVRVTFRTKRAAREFMRRWYKEYVSRGGLGEGRHYSEKTDDGWRLHFISPADIPF